MSGTSRAITVLVGAVGGEGVRTLMQWIVDAAAAQGLPVQSTFVPGVSQRTGATTYYIEIFPVSLDELDGREPVLALLPSVGDVDLVVAAELVEVGRAIERGFVDPDRTTLIGSTHRLYSVAEKIVGADGRYDSDRVLNAAPATAKRAILFDGRQAAGGDRQTLNAVLLGAIAGSGVLPIPPSAFEDAIGTGDGQAPGILDGFAKGLALGRGEVAEPPAVADRTRETADATPQTTEATPQTAGAPAAATPAPRELHAASGKTAELIDRARSQYPVAAQTIVVEGVARLVDYQDAAYAELYLDRLDTVMQKDRDAAGAAKLTAETGRHLALWMSHEDVFRVAQLKTRRERFERVRAEVRAEPDDIVRVTEFLTPGVEEFCSVLPPFMARPILRWSERRSSPSRPGSGMNVKTTTVSGFLRLRLMASLRRLRRVTHGYKELQELIEAWLDLVRRAADVDRDLAIEVACCARLVRGYGDTRKRGLAHFNRIVEEIVAPALAGDGSPQAAAREVATARTAALDNPEQGCH